jgi:opacity protein-like surface antigen
MVTAPETAEQAAGKPRDTIALSHSRSLPAPHAPGADRFPPELAMPLPSSRLVLFAACALAAAAPPAAAQTRDRWREEDERRERRERLEREREAREEREYRARESARRAAEARTRVARDRAEREREARLREARLRAERAAEQRRRRDDWGDSYRPRVSLGGGIDVRDFGGDGDRYVVQGGVDFRSRSGFGVRPELLFAWSESSPTGLLLPCPTCSAILPGTASQTTGTGRSRMIGVAVTGTYTLARSSPVRPYLLSGLGVFSTRTPQTVVTQLTTGTTPSFQSGTQFRNDLDVGLTAGGGLEFDLGPVRLFTEFRYLLTDQARPRGFSGMLPLTAGLRL